MDNQRFFIRSEKYKTPISVLIVASMLLFVSSIVLPRNINIFTLIASLVAITSCVLLAVSIFGKAKKIPKVAVFATVALYALFSAVSVFIIQILFYLVFAAALVCVTVCLYNGRAKPIYLIVIASAGITLETICALYDLGRVFVFAGMICFYVVIILLALNEKAAYAHGGSDDSIENQLAMLKSALDSGIITEEQYREKRAKILANL